METLLVKIFATALALSQVTTDAGRGEDRVRPRPRSAAGGAAAAGRLHPYAQGLRYREHQPRRADRHRDGRPAGAIGEIKAFRGINFADLQTAYRQFCKNETVAKLGRSISAT